MYRSMMPLDTVQHRELRVNQAAATLDNAKDLNAVFLNVVEFADACREYPIVFVRTGEAKDGKPAPVAPLAVLGLNQGENLFMKDGSKWDAEYAPAYLRRYPFCMARLDAESDRLAVCVDDTWNGFSTTDGERLFDDKGEATEFTKGLVGFLESFETESERTQQACNELEAAGIFEDMKFEAQVGDGPKIEVTGFLAVNHEKLMALPDDKVLAYHRNGLLQLVEMHRLSLSNMSRLAAKRNNM
jgi:hypothetical protein